MTKITNEHKIEIIEKYKTNTYSCVTLGKEYNVCNVTIQNILKANNIKIKGYSESSRKYPINKNYFDQIDTEEKSYFLGLLYADGCNMEEKNVVKICLQEQDKLILEKLNKAIGSNRPLYFHNKSVKNIKHKNLYTLQITNKYMSQQLAKLGCIARKSLTLKFPTEEQVPSHLIRHFIRGYIDGDGCINKFLKTNAISVSLCSTFNFCESIKNLIKEELNINCYISKPRKDKNEITRQLHIGGKFQVKKFLDWIYQNATIYLDRKYEKYINYL